MVKRAPGHTMGRIAHEFDLDNVLRYRGICECGWRTLLHPSDDGARKFLNAHRAGIASARKREVRIPKAERR